MSYLDRLREYLSIGSEPRYPLTIGLPSARMAGKNFALNEYRNVLNDEIKAEFDATIRAAMQSRNEHIEHLTTHHEMKEAMNNIYSNAESVRITDEARKAARIAADSGLISRAVRMEVEKEADRIDKRADNLRESYARQIRNLENLREADREQANTAIALLNSKLRERNDKVAALSADVERLKADKLVLQRVSRRIENAERVEVEPDQPATAEEIAGIQELLAEINGEAPPRNESDPDAPIAPFFLSEEAGAAISNTHTNTLREDLNNAMPEPHAGGIAVEDAENPGKYFCICVDCQTDRAEARLLAEITPKPGMIQIMGENGRPYWGYSPSEGEKADAGPEWNSPNPVWVNAWDFLQLAHSAGGDAVEVVARATAYKQWIENAEADARKEKGK